MDDLDKKTHCSSEYCLRSSVGQSVRLLIIRSSKSWEADRSILDHEKSNMSPQLSWIEHTPPKRGAGSSNLPGDAINAVTARGCGIFLIFFRYEDQNRFPFYHWLEWRLLTPICSNFHHRTRTIFMPNLKKLLILLMSTAAAFYVVSCFPVYLCTNQFFC